jgi:hypothetical protein
LSVRRPPAPASDCRAGAGAGGFSTAIMDLIILTTNGGGGGGGDRERPAWARDGRASC